MTSPTPQARVLFESFPGEPGLDTAISAAILRRVADGEIAETIRLYIPAQVVAFGRQDVASPRYQQAVAAARAGGFAAVERLAGGRAAVFTPSTIAFSWAIPDPDPTTRTQARFEMVSGLVRDSLTELGVDARIGEVPGEYCPGRFSVSASGRIKLMGVGQRLVRGAAHLGGVLVVADSAAIRTILEPVYAALELEWRPEVTGAIADVVPTITMETALASLGDAIGSARNLAPTELSAETLALARQLAPSHLSP